MRRDLQSLLGLSRTQKLQFSRIVYSNFVALASVLGFAFTAYPWKDSLTCTHYILISAAFLAFFLLSALEIREFMATLPFVFKGKDRKKIRDYMYDWIKTGSNVAIFTRNMSWAREDDYDMIGMLGEKAKEGELTILIQEPIWLTEKLSSLPGSKVKIASYGSSEHDPSSRFTIVRKGTRGAMVAIGEETRYDHHITEYHCNSGPIYDLAHDLCEIICNYQAKISALESQLNTMPSQDIEADNASGEVQE